ncbi:MAG: helix-turn-helix transcriptional regulator [Polyangiaceae bacterium]
MAAPRTLDEDSQRTDILPNGRLGRYVERIWTLRRDANAPLPHLLPGTGAEVLFFIGEPPILIDSNGKRQRLAPTCVLNLRTRSARFRTQAQISFVSLRIRTGMLGALSSEAPEEHIDACVSAEAVFGPKLAILGELVSTVTLRRAASVVHDFFQTLATRAVLPESTVRQAASRLYYGAASERIEGLAADLGITRRHLERRFLATTGLTPKEYQRIARLHHAVRALLLERRSDYLPTALRYGFYDQAHFIHELRALAGLKPSELLTEREFRSHFYNPPSSMGVILRTHDVLERTR